MKPIRRTGHAVGNRIDQADAADQHAAHVAFVQCIEQAQRRSGCAQVARQGVAGNLVNGVVHAGNRCAALQLAHVVPMLQADDAVREADGIGGLVGLDLGVFVLGQDAAVACADINGVAAQILDLVVAVG